MRLIDEQYTRTPFYGIRKMTRWLGEQGYAVNPKRIRRLMRQMGLEAIYRVTGPTVFPRGCQRIFRPLSRIPFLGDWTAVLREHGSGIGYSPV